MNCTLSAKKVRVWGCVFFVGEWVRGWVCVGGVCFIIMCFSTLNAFPLKTSRSQMIDLIYQVNAQLATYYFNVHCIRALNSLKRDAIRKLLRNPLSLSKRKRSDIIILCNMYFCFYTLNVTMNTFKCLLKWFLRSQNYNDILYSMYIDFIIFFPGCVE